MTLERVLAEGHNIYSMSQAHSREIWEDGGDYLLNEAVRRFVHDLLREHLHVPRTLSVRVLAFKDEADVFVWNADYRRRLIEDYRSPQDHPDLVKVLTATRLGEVIIEITALTEPLKITSIQEGSLARKETA